MQAKTAMAELLVITNNMEVTVAVLYKAHLAYYKVMQQDSSFEASLLYYTGYAKDAPPRSVVFSKTGEHCSGTADTRLMDDLWEAVEEDSKGDTGKLAVMTP